MNTDELNRWIGYHGEISRAMTAERTSLESALIPVTAYILIACIECYRRYPEMMDVIADASTPEALGRAGREPGSQIDAVHLWSIVNFPLLGRQVLAPFGLVDLDRDVSDQSRPWLANGAHIQQAHTWELVVPKCLVLTKQLVAATHTEHHRAARSCLMQRVALTGNEVLRAEQLVAVLAASQVVDVVRLTVERLTEPATAQLKADSAPCAATLQHEQVAAVGVDVHQIGVQCAHA